MTVIASPVRYSPTWTYFEDEWRPGNVAIMGVRTHAAWLGSTVFDGARAFEGVTPDLDKHLQRANQSAANFMLTPHVSVDDWMALAKEGLERFDGRTPLYIRPMYWAEDGAGGGVKYDPATTRWCLSIYEAPMPEPKGVSITLSPYRRPSKESAPVEAKAGCLYPNNARAIQEANGRGFDNALMRDAMGDVAELANANVFMVKDGVVRTPAPNGSFLNGITRQRVIALLREAGQDVVEETLGVQDFNGADEIFSTGNFNKLAPVVRIEERELQPGPIYRLGRQLYWEFAHVRL